MALSNNRVGGYNPEYFERLIAVEDRHFWFCARNSVIRRLAAQAVAGLAPGYRVLEVGCGTGNVLRHLQTACGGGLTVGMDFHLKGLTYARSRTSCPLVQGDARRPPFSAGFQLIGLFDVLEHVPDDAGLLRDMRRLLVENGVLLLTVPAHPSLWSAFDEASGHCRRYTRPELRERLQAAGFQIERLTEFMFSIFPLMWLARRRSAGNENAVDRELRVIPGINGVLRLLLTGEAAWLARGGRLPIGASLVAVARKR